MNACPKCRRPLAVGARSCVYCAQGNAYQRRPELAVPKGATGYRKAGLPWGKLLLVLVAAVGLGAALVRPEVRAWLKGAIEKAKSLF